MTSHQALSRLASSPVDGPRLALPAVGSKGGNLFSFLRNAELTQYLDDQWKAIIATDVDGPGAVPTKVDSDSPVYGKRHTARRLARTVFLGATPTLHGAQKGIDRSRVFLGTALPGDTPGNFHSALESIADRATYFYSGGTAYWYDTSAP